MNAQFTVTINQNASNLTPVSPCGTNFKCSLIQSAYNQATVVIKYGGANVDNTWTYVGCQYLGWGGGVVGSPGAAGGSTPTYYILLNHTGKTITWSTTEPTCGLPDPEIKISPASLTPFSTCPGTVSQSQSITVTGSNLQNNISISGVTGYQYSTDNGSTWGTAGDGTSLPAGGGVLLIRLAAGGTAGANLNGTITLSSTGAQDIGVPLSGSIKTPAVTFRGVTNINFCPSDEEVTLESLPEKNCADWDITYSWEKDGTTIAGATEASYTITNPTSDDNGDYMITAIYDGTTLATHIFHLFTPAGTDSYQPVLTGDGEGCPDETVEISISNAPSSGMVYIWYNNGIVIPNENGSALSLTLAEDETYAITVKAIDVCGSESLISGTWTIAVLGEEDGCDSCDGTPVFNIDFGTGPAGALTSSACSACQYITTNVPFNQNLIDHPDWYPVGHVLFNNGRAYDVNTNQINGAEGYFFFCAGDYATFFTLQKGDLDRNQKYLLSFNMIYAGKHSIGAFSLILKNKETGGTLLSTAATSSWKTYNIEINGGDIIDGINFTASGTAAGNIRIAFDNISLTPICSLNFRITKSTEDYCESGVTLSVQQTSIDLTGATYLWKVWDESTTQFINAPGTNNGPTYTVSGPIEEDVRYSVTVTVNGESKTKEVTLACVKDPDCSEGKYVFVWTGNSDSNWNNPANWESESGISRPRSCDDIVLNGDVPRYPVLTEKVQCKNIHFKNGTSIGKIHNLEYEYASAELTLKSFRWYMFTSPFQGAISGHFYNAELFTFLRYFSVEGETGVWSKTITDLSAPIELGKGIVLQAFNMINPNADITFTLPPSRFAIENGDEFETQVVIDLNGEYDADPTTGIENQTGYVMISNPYMSHLDLDAFFIANPEINPNIKVYSNSNYGSGSFATFVCGDSTLNTEPGTPNKVAPLQAFFIDPGSLISTDGTITLTFDADEMSVTSNAVKLRSTMISDNILRINASIKGISSVDAVIKAESGVSNEYTWGEDSRKLFAQDAAIEVVTMAGEIPCDINRINKEELDGLVIPVNIYTGKTGILSLEVKGAIGFISAEDILLYDSKTGETTSLFDKNLFEINKTETGNLTDRFYLIFEQNEDNSDPTDTDGDFEKSKVFVGTKDKNLWVESRGEQIMSVTVYDITGKIVLSAGDIRSTTFSHSLYGPMTYITKVITEKSVLTEKIIIK
jgi:hypothetical protein